MQVYCAGVEEQKKQLGDRRRPRAGRDRRRRIHLNRRANEPTAPSRKFHSRACTYRKDIGAKALEVDFRPMNRTAARFPTGKVVLDAKGIAETISKLTAQAIAKEFGSQRDEVALVGIQTRGVLVARRIAAQLNAKWNRDVPVGVLDITLYRDDVHAIGDQPEVKETEIPFDMEDRPVVLVDDVLFTGRTIRSAMNALADYSRPECIRLAVLVDRGHRELPIGADYVGLTLELGKDDVVDVNLKEIDEEEAVRIRRRKKE